MPTMIRILTPDGLQPAPYSADTLNDAAQYEPADGVYTVASTFNGTQTLKLDAHLDRLEDSARRVNIPLELNRAKLRSALRQMIEESGFGSVRFRITLTREHPDQLTLSIEPFTTNIAQLVANGIRCATVPGSARNNPAAKYTGWMHERKAAIDSTAAAQKVDERLLVSENGDILEGFGSNFYTILDGELRTAHEGVLAGIARQIIYEIAPEILPLRKDPINVRDIPNLSEAFISSSSRGIIPVIEIDGHTLSGGKPGPQTLGLRKLYDAWVESHLEEL
jgi:branched-chain amino acid aminotransferase